MSARIADGRRARAAARARVGRRALSSSGMLRRLGVVAVVCACGGGEPARVHGSEEVVEKKVEQPVEQPLALSMPAAHATYCFTDETTATAGACAPALGVGPGSVGMPDGT
jgi:hypothetical protein